MKKNILRALFALLLFIPLTQLVRADDKLPSVESFFQNDELGAVAISPSGHHVVVAQRLPDSRYVVAVIDTADPKKINVLGAMPTGWVVGYLGWVNEHRIYYHIVDFDRGAKLIASELDGSRQENVVVGGNSDQASGLWSAMHDGSDNVITVTYTYDRKTLVNTHLRRTNTDRSNEVNMDSVLQPKHVTSWRLDVHDFPRIAGTNFQLQCAWWYLPEKSDSWVELVKNGCYEDTGFTPFFLESDHNLYVTQNLNGYKALYTYDLKSMKLANEPLINIKGFDLSGTIQFDYGAKKVLGLHYLSDAESTLWFDADMKAAQQKIDQLLPATNNTIDCGADCLNSPAMLVASQSDRQPSQYYIFSKSTGTITALGGSKPEIKPAQMGRRDFDHYAARDGMEIPVYVTIPPGKHDAPMPTVVLVHGGPWMRGSSWEWEAEAQFLASRGYVVIQPEFRGSTGFGSALFKAGFKQWGLTMQDDLADAANWAIKKGWTDPKRIAIMGGSYGGYATLMGLIKNPELFRCGVAMAAETDLIARFNSPESDASDAILDFDLKTLVGDPDTDKVMFKQNSPLEHADKITQPLLIEHGGLDRRIPISHASDLVSAVRKHNDHVEWIVYNDEGHGLAHEENRIDLWKHIETFLDKNLKNVE